MIVKEKNSNIEIESEETESKVARNNEIKYEINNLNLNKNI